MAFHGTRADSVKSILEGGDLLIPGLHNTSMIGGVHKETVSRHCACATSRADQVSSAKITLATKGKISLLGSEAGKLVCQGQIVAIGGDLQYFWQILISRHSGQKSRAYFLGL